jgi:hypothetical protein
MSDIIYTPPASGGGGTNPTNNIIPVNKSGVFQDSSIVDNAGVTSTNQGQGTGDPFGWYVDFNNYLVNIGDVSFLNNGIYLSIDDYGGVLQTYYSGQIRGLILDFNSNIYYLGNQNQSNIQLIDQANNYNFLTYLNGQGYGINTLLTSTRNETYLGDFDGNYTNDRIVINGTQKSIKLTTNNFATEFLIDGGSDKLTFTANFLNFVGTSLTDSTIVTPAGRNLKVTINGTTYHIPLYN